MTERCPTCGQLPTHGNSILTETDARAITAARLRGDTMTTICRDLKLPRTPVAKVLRGQTWTSVTGGPLPGPKTDRTRPLTADEIAEIWRRLEAGEPVADIASAIGRSRQTIYRYYKLGRP